MKKVMITVIILVALLLVSGCDQKDTSINTLQTESVQTETPKESEEPEKDSLEFRIEQEKQKWSVPALLTENTYVNEACGYEFVFPSDWTGWYFINEENPQAVVVRFYGKSMRGTISEKMFFDAGDYGLTMFFILSEEEVHNGTYDSVTLIGTAQEVNYYFATTTDVSLAPIIGEGSFWFDESAEEQELMKKDWEKAKEMMKFYSYENLNNLSNAFRIQ